MDYDIQKFISRLETMQKNGDAWLTINAVLSLLEDCKEPVFHLRSYGDVSKSDLESYVNDSIQALGAGIGLTPEEFAEAAKDLGWAPAPAEGDDLPPLPEADFTGDRVIEASLYSADQMRAYALAARTNPQPKGMEPYGWVHELWVDGEMAGLSAVMHSQADLDLHFGVAGVDHSGQVREVALYTAPQARAPAPETADTRDEDDLHTIERAADLLEGYAAYIRNDGAENLQYHPYLPEVDMIAEELRMYATKRDVLAAELDTAIHARADESGASPLPPLSRIGRAGTGGLESTEFYMLRPGYLPFVVVRSEVSAAAVMPYAGYMAEVKAGFGRTMSRLPEVFGVSRTTLYNWLKGDAPKAMYEQRIEQLARAARAFDELGFKPTATMLDRTVAGGKSFLQLMSEGADGRETAKRMVRIAQRGAESRSKLDALLAGQKPTALSADDFGTPSLKEDV